MPTISGAAVDSVTSWYSCTDGAGRQILYINGSETGDCPRMVSVLGDLPAPATRMAGPEWTTPEPIEGETAGLVVYGRHKGDRPGLRDALNLDAAAARAVASDCARSGRGYRDPIVFAEVRRNLGLSGADLGAALGLAADNPDPDKRRANAGRSVRRYEADGAPPTIALALRWLALQAGIIDLDAARQ